MGAVIAARAVLMAGAVLVTASAAAVLVAVVAGCTSPVGIRGSGALMMHGAIAQRAYRRLEIVADQEPSYRAEREEAVDGAYGTHWNRT